jgi:glycosyltransferase
VKPRFGILWKVLRIWKAGYFDKKRFLTGWTLPHPTFFVRKTVYEQFGVFDETFKIAADYELILRFLYKNEIKVGYLPITIIKMRTGGASNGNFQKRLLAHQEDRLAWSLNQLQPHFYTIYLKPIWKILQFRPFSKLKTHFCAFYE